MKIALQAAYNPKKLTDNSFKIGKIISLDLTKNDGIVIKGNYKTRKKYIVVIGISEENIIGVVLINHAINYNALPTKELQDCQYPIKKTDYPHILQVNSFIDCSEIFELNKERVKKEGEDEKDLTHIAHASSPYQKNQVKNIFYNIKNGQKEQEQIQNHTKK